MQVSEALIRESFTPYSVPFIISSCLSAIFKWADGSTQRHRRANTLAKDTVLPLAYPDRKLIFVKLSYLRRVPCSSFSWYSWRVGLLHFGFTWYSQRTMFSRIIPCFCLCWYSKRAPHYRGSVGTQERYHILVMLVYCQIVSIHWYSRILMN
jgi:hypothetical protein